MKDVIRDFELVIKESCHQLMLISDLESTKPIAPGRWSKKEILGHLIDSAANNHQRFIRAQVTNNISLPGYEQAAWVKYQAYQDAAWTDLVLFWRSYNLHLLHIVAHMPEERLNNLCSVGTAEPVAIRYLVDDYLRHIVHHVKQILAPLSPVGTAS